MSDVIFLNPATAIPGDVTTLTQLCKDVLLTKLSCRVVDEQLCPIDNTDTVFDSLHTNWVLPATPKVFKNGSGTGGACGTGTLLFTPADYSIDLLAGRVTLVNALVAGETLTANYNFFPFTDPQLVEIVKSTIVEISGLIWRPIPQNAIPSDYRPVICERFYTNVLKSLILEARDFFSVTVAGRTINKSGIVAQISAIIDQNETQVLPALNVFRHYNKTNRVLPTITLTKTIASEAFNGQRTIQTITSDATVI